MLALGAQLALVPEKERGGLVDDALRALDALKAQSVKHIAKVSYASGSSRDSEAQLCDWIVS